MSQMISYDEMPDDNAELANIVIDFPHVDDASTPDEIEPDLLDYLEIEGFSPDGDLKFLRTALVEKTVYWIWSFETAGKPAYATATMDEKDDSCVGCGTNEYGLTPEQYILGDYHNCF